MEYHNFHIEIIRQKLLTREFAEYQKFMVLPGAGENTLARIADRRLYMPFPRCTFQWIWDTLDGEPGKDLHVCIFTREYEDYVDIKLFNRQRGMVGWRVLPSVKLNRENWHKPTTDYTPKNIQFAVALSAEAARIEAVTGGIYGQMLSPLFHYLNLLATPGVSMSRAQQNRHAVSALPMDGHWMLTVRPSSGSNYHGGTHRSPREHDRRAHQRTIKVPNGTKQIPVRSTTVCRGRGGRIEKEYTHDPV
jgi:hypothetical protein